MSTTASAQESASCYVACVHSAWDKTAFRRHLRRLMSEAELSQHDVAGLAGISRPQVSRWTRAEHRPDFDALSKLAAAVRRERPDLGDTVTALVAAAGYKPPTPPRPVWASFPDNPELDRQAARIWELGHDDEGQAVDDDMLRNFIEIARVQVEAGRAGNPAARRAAG